MLPIVELSSTPNKDPKDKMNRLAKVIQRYSEKHNIPLFLFATQPLGAHKDKEGNDILDTKALVMVNRMTPQLAMLLGKELTRIERGFGNFVQIGMVPEGLQALLMGSAPQEEVPANVTRH